MAYTDDGVKAKLSALNETQESIVTVAQWVMFHRYPQFTHPNRCPAESFPGDMQTVQQPSGFSVSKILGRTNALISSTSPMKLLSNPALGKRTTSSLLSPLSSLKPPPQPTKAQQMKSSRSSAVLLRYGASGKSSNPLFKRLLKPVSMSWTNRAPRARNLCLAAHCSLIHLVRPRQQRYNL